MSKKKMSKKEKEKLEKAKEDEAGKKDEEERLKLELEQQERDERDRRDVEERANMMLEEEARHRDEATELNTWRIQRASKLRAKMISNRKLQEWDKYVSCTSMPNPAIERDVNTYINLWKNSKANKSLSAVLDECIEAEEFVRDSQSLIIEAIDSGNIERARCLSSTSTSLRDLIYTKLREVTAHVVQYADEVSEKDTMENIQVSISKKYIKYGLWANLAKNPRVKNVEFAGLQLSLDIPKPLALASVALCVRYIAHDHLTPRPDTFIEPVVETTSEAVTENHAPTVTGESGEVVDGETVPNGEKADGSDVVAPGIANAGEIVNKDSDEKKDGAEKKVDVAPTGSVSLDEKKDAGGDADGADGGENSNKDGIEAGSTNVGEVGASEPVEGEAAGEGKTSTPTKRVVGTVDDKLQMTFGGVIFFDVLSLLPPPKLVKGWLIRQVVTKKDELFGNDVPLVTAASPSFRVSFQVPDGVSILQSPKPAWFDEDEGSWRTNGLMAVTVDSADRTVSLEMMQFKPITLVQDRFSNFPYSVWTIMPIGGKGNQCKIFIRGALYEVAIEVREDGFCRLLRPMDKALVELHKEWVNANDFIQHLLFAGINIFPDENAAQYVKDITLKNKGLETEAHFQLSLCVTAFAFESSKWSKARPEKYIFKAAECIGLDDVPEESWRNFIYDGRISFPLRITEEENEFFEELDENGIMHPDIYHVMNDRAQSSEAIERLRNSSVFFTQAVHVLLDAIRPFSFNAAVTGLD